MKRFDVVGSHLLFPAPAFMSRDGRLVMHEIHDGRLTSERKIDTKELARAHAGKGQRSFPQCLARDRPGVDPGATDLAKFFHQRDALAKNPRGIRSANAGRPATDHYYVEVLGHGR